MPSVAISEIERPKTIGLADGRILSWRDRPLIMGVLNLTPDSFSDAGLWTDPHAAIEHARSMVDQGADLLDIGAESSRPGGGIYGQGAQPVAAEEELERLLPILKILKAELSVPLSVDTRKGSVARAALQAGADLINDITALGDRELATVVAEVGCPIVLMHSRGTLRSMQRDIAFNDVAAEVRDELKGIVERACAQGINRDRILVDPGIGFGKTGGQNLELLRHLDALNELGQPILLGASRKAFIGELIDRPATQRVAGSLAAIGWAALHHAAIVRVHDVAETHQFLTVWRAIETARGSQGEPT